MRGIQICAYFFNVDSVDPLYIYTMQSKGFHVEPVDIKSIQIKICSYLDTVDIKEMKPI